MKPQKTLTVQEVADRLQVHADTVIRWIKDKQLLAMNVTASCAPKTQRYRIDPDDLRAFELSRKTVAPPPMTGRRKPIAKKHYFR